PPLGVTATDGTSDTTIAVTWSASAGAATYRVYRDGTQIAEIAATHYDDTGASTSVPAAPTAVAATDGTYTDKVTVTFTAATAPAGPMHTYTVTAVNAAGASAQSPSDTGFRAGAVAAYLVYRDAVQIPIIQATSYDHTTAS